MESEETHRIVAWLEGTLPRVMRRLIDSENLDMPLLQLPLAQMRLANTLYHEEMATGADVNGQTMGRLSERMGVRQNALTQAADRLVNHGLAERVSDSSDRRIVRLRLTVQGREWVEARRARRRAHLTDLWHQMTPDEHAEFVKAVRVLEHLVDRTIGSSSGTSEIATEPFLVQMSESSGVTVPPISEEEKTQVSNALETVL